MSTKNKVLMANARQTLAGQWKQPLLTYLLYMLITSIGGVAGLIINGPMQLGSAIFSLNIARKKELELSQIFEGFKLFTESFVAYILIVLFTSLWSLLFIIPGIIAALSYSQTFYILADNKISALDAIKESKKIMYGNKWKLFCLGFRFIGWGLLAILTFGIGLLWLVPYMSVSFANFYEDIKQ